MIEISLCHHSSIVDDLRLIILLLKHLLLQQLLLLLIDVFLVLAHIFALIAIVFLVLTLVHLILLVSVAILLAHVDLLLLQHHVCRSSVLHVLLRWIEAMRCHLVLLALSRQALGCVGKVLAVHSVHFFVVFLRKVLLLLTLHEHFNGHVSIVRHLHLIHILLLKALHLLQLLLI